MKSPYMSLFSNSTFPYIQHVADISHQHIKTLYLLNEKWIFMSNLIKLKKLNEYINERRNLKKNIREQEEKIL